MLSGFLDGLYPSRQSVTDTTFPPSFATQSLYGTSDVKQYLLDAGLDAALGKDWKASLLVSSAAERNNGESSSFVMGTPGTTLQVDELLRGRTNSAELNVDGPLLPLGSDAARVAVGAGYRRENVDSVWVVGPNSSLRGKRNVKYAFGEMNVPLAQLVHGWGVKELNFNLSGRYDDYSDVGGKFVPKLGVLFAPVDSLKMRATWSESFRAPGLSDIDGGYAAYLLTVPNPAAHSGASQILYTNGANSGLRPETATSWTAGFDYSPLWIARTHFTMTYFDINYKNRIYGFNLPGFAFTDPVYRPFLTLNPTPAQLQTTIQGATGGFFNYSGVPYDSAAIAALVNGTTTNISAERVNGVDLLADYQQPVGGGMIDMYLNGSYLQFRQQLSPLASQVEFAGIAFNPPRWRARGGATWQGAGGWSTTAIVNWLAPSTDSYASGSPAVAAWATVDLQLSYATDVTGPLAGIKASLSVQNVFDRDPPYVLGAATIPGFNYDSANTTPLGRFVTLQLSKAWGGTKTSNK